MSLQTADGSGVVRLQLAHILHNFVSFYPQDAMLARVLVMALCLSVTSQCSIETADKLRSVLAQELPSIYIFYTMLKENSGISKN